MPAYGHQLERPQVIVTNHAEHQHCQEASQLEQNQNQSAVAYASVLSALPLNSAGTQHNRQQHRWNQQQQQKQPANLAHAGPVSRCVPTGTNWSAHRLSGTIMPNTNQLIEVDQLLQGQYSTTSTLRRRNDGATGTSLACDFTSPKYGVMHPRAVHLPHWPSDMKHQLGPALHHLAVVTFLALLDR
jgi:hypothetical protein